MPRAALALWPATVGMVLILANVAISSEPALAVSRPRPPIVPLPLPSYHRLVVKSVTPARLAQPIPKALRPLVADVQYHDLPNLKGCSLHTMRLGGTCVLGDLHASRSFAVLGDSHANAWMSALDYFALQHHYRLIGLTRDGCTIGTFTGNHTACSPFWTRWLQQLSSENPKFLVVAQRWDTRLQPQQLYDDQNLELSKLDQLVPRTVVMEDTPYHPLINPTDCLLRSGATLGDCTLTWTADMSAEYAAMRSIVQSHPKDRLLRTRDWFCASDKCPIVIGDMIVYRDYQHISETYARHLAPAVSRSLWDLTKNLP